MLAQLRRLHGKSLFCAAVRKCRFQHVLLRGRTKVQRSVCVMHLVSNDKGLFLLLHLLLTLMLVLLIVMLLLQLLIWSTDRGIPRFGGQTIKFNDLECRPSNSMS